MEKLFFITNTVLEWSEFRLSSLTQNFENEQMVNFKKNLAYLLNFLKMFSIDSSKNQKNPHDLKIIRKYFIDFWIPYDFFHHVGQTGNH